MALRVRSSADRDRDVRGDLLPAVVLQVLTGEQYVCKPPRTACATCRSPRAGQILDREGQPIAASMVTTRCRSCPRRSPAAARLAVYRRLGALLG